MKRFIIILYCLVINIAANGVTYTPYSNNAAGYNTTYPSAQIQPYQYAFKSTSSYTSMTSYQTVKPLDDNGFVSGEYTTYDRIYKPRNMRSGLDLDDKDEPTGGMVPIGEPIVPLLILILAYLSYQEIKRQRERKHFFIQKNEA